MNFPGRDIVVIGASAGGVDALKRLVSGFSPDFPGSVFIVLHLAPNTRSYLPEILSRCGPLPASPAQNNAPIQRGRIYLAPNDLHLVLLPDRMALVRGPRENRTRPAINPLFRSAALSYGPRVVGVVLTGLLDDGASGLWAIQQRGGIAIVQNPADAAFPEMPQNAVNEVNVDYTLPIDEIPPLLMRLASEPFEAETPTTPPLLNFKAESVLMRTDTHDIDAIGKRTLFTCPECHGALWELSEGGNLEYRCHVGHVFSPSNLEAEQWSSLEQSLWSALRALQESAALDQRLADRSSENDLLVAAAVHRNNAERKTAQADQLKSFLQTMGKSGSESGK